MPRKKVGDKVKRLTVSFSIGAGEWLEEEAAKRGISVSEIVRRMVDEVRGAAIINPRREN
jgi:hypothetical protein